MALTKAQRKALAAEGLGKDELAKLETILDADADDDSGSNGDKPSGRRVVVIEGDDVEPFLSKMFGESSSDDDGDDDGDDDDDDETEADDKPKGRTRWFG